MKRCPVCSNLYDSSSLFCTLDAARLEEFDDEATTEVKRPFLQTFDTGSYLGKLFNNKYKIDSLLGRGGMGAVYKAVDTILDRAVAIKLLHSELAAEENFSSRFLREARAAARIEHPHAVTVHDFGTLPDGEAFIVMEFIQGQSLRQLIKKESRLRIKHALELFRQVCTAVAAAHKEGVIHRDLKPENIMLKSTSAGAEVVKVVDFGLAKLKESSGKSLTNLTNKGEIIGTPYYMSPEQCSGIEIDECTDIYSLGIILYEMVVGQPPFQGSTVAVIGMHLYKPVQSLCQDDPAFPQLLDKLLLAMLAKEKKDRIQTVETILQQIELITCHSDQIFLLQNSFFEASAKSETANASTADEQMLKKNTHKQQSGTEGQGLETHSYNAVDFQTKQSATSQDATANPSSLLTLKAVKSGYEETANIPVTTVVKVEEQSSRELILVGVIGFIMGVIAVLVFA
ncbi:MAG: serine/threonine protein kinase [Blastocatellia bacterium]|nr:serine/threonine protein kinase [Blastocatellia bacterium]